MENPEGERPPKKERWPSTVFVVILLKNRKPYGLSGNYESDNFVLVRKRDSGKWSPITGGIEQGERSSEAAWRELMEETGLGRNEVFFEFATPAVRLIPGEQGTAVGVFHNANVKERIPPGGYEFAGDEIDFVKAFSFRELIELRESPERIYKPEYNQVLINHWLWDWLNSKYAFEGYEFVKNVAESWGIEEPKDFFR